jgi:hypothetical protein
LRDLLVLSLRDGFDPLSYYLQDLHRPGGCADAAFYLTRDETKNGLFNQLNRMLPAPTEANEMKDKVMFAERCRAAQVAVPSTLLACDADGVTRLAPREAFDRDLFCKPRNGRGARGTLMFERIAHERFRASDGADLGLDALIERLGVLGRSTPLVLQPHLRNHAEIADLADRSLVTIRVLTCLDADARPVATHGVLRVLSKLERDWKWNDEFGAPIDLATGRLGAMTSDRLARCAFRYAHHPVTGARVEGRLLAGWPEIQALAVEAHRAFPHRVLVGWDIAHTVDGPLLLEGNINLDVMFPQRAYGEGFGHGALAPLLAHHLAKLAAAHGVAD